MMPLCLPSIYCTTFTLGKGRYGINFTILPVRGQFLCFVPPPPPPSSISPRKYKEYNLQLLFPIHNVVRGDNWYKYCSKWSDGVMLWHNSLQWDPSWHGVTRDRLEWSGEIVVMSLSSSLLLSSLLSTTPTHSPAKMITQAGLSSPGKC